MVAHKVLSMVMEYRTAVTGYEYRDAKRLKADARCGDLKSKYGFDSAKFEKLRADDYN